MRFRSVNSASCSWFSIMGAVQSTGGGWAARNNVPAQSTSGRSKSMSIGAVLKLIKPDYPQITHSKIRYLESEGLLEPQRTATGYRSYTMDDVERLRFILDMQRDRYLPLKVIRSQLEAIDRGEVSALPASQADEAAHRGSDRMKLSELAVQTAMSEDDLMGLINAGLITPDAAGLFSSSDVSVIAVISQLVEYGLDVRHLKSLKNHAQRQVDLVSQVAGPVARAKDDAARGRAEEIARQMMSLIVSLNEDVFHRELLKEFGS